MALTFFLLAAFVKIAIPAIEGEISESAPARIGAILKAGVHMHRSL